jgi:hypothetical protein
MWSVDEQIDLMHSFYSVCAKNVQKRSIFWDITLCSLLKVNRRFGGTHCLHLQGRQVSKQETSMKQAANVQKCGEVSRTSSATVEFMAIYSVLLISSVRFVSALNKRKTNEERKVPNKAHLENICIPTHGPYTFSLVMIRR